MATREWVAAEIGVRLATLLTEAGMTADDTTGNLKEPIDDALRMLDTAEDDIDTAAPDDAPGFLLLVRYTTLKAILDRVSENVDVSLGGRSFRLNQIVKNVQELLTRVEADILGVYGVAAADMAADIFTLDLYYLGARPERDMIG